MVPAVLLGETAPVDKADKAEQDEPAVASSTDLPDASLDDHGDTDPGMPLLSVLPSTSVLA